MPDLWPDHLPVTRLRIARPTGQFEAVVGFYRDVIGLPQLDRFDDHDGYSGVMIGLPGEGVHLEITTHSDGVDGTAPTRDNLLVLYIDDAAAIAALIERMAAHGYQPVSPENPYWANGGVSYEDPDGWGVVFMNMTARTQTQT